MWTFEAVGTVRAIFISKEARWVGLALAPIYYHLLTIAGIDGFDTVEFIAGQPWCNGAVSMCGNSWLATEQWATAIQQPPSLKCIAPWEAFTDKYRDLVCRGGVPKTNFASFVFNKTIRGRTQREDIAGALAKWPLFNAYWADKVYDTSGITIPIYALASYSSGNHGSGTVRGWRNAASKEKWIRFHATQEWFDLYTPRYIDDLQRFFDRYLKGIENGWEQTPRARISILTYGNRFEPVRCQFSRLVVLIASGKKKRKTKTNGYPGSQIGRPVFGLPYSIHRIPVALSARGGQAGAIAASQRGLCCAQSRQLPRKAVRVHLEI